MMSDDELIHRWAQDRDEAAFRSLVERYAGLVHGVAWRRLGGDRLLAEEIVQNVFALLARKAAGLAGHPALGAWLHRAAVLECSHARRHETTRHRHLEALAEHTALMSDDPSAAWSAAAAEPELDEALAALSASDRHILLLRFFEGRSFREIGAALGKTEATAQRQSSRAVERLAAQLRQRGVAVPATVLAGGLATSLAHSAPAGLAVAVVPSALAAGGSLTAAQLLTHTLAMTLHGKNLLSTAAAILLVLACLGGSFLLGRQQARAAQSEASSRNAAAPATSDGPRRPPALYPNAGATAIPQSRKPPLREMLQRIAELGGSDQTMGGLIDSFITLGHLEPGDLPEALKLLPEFKSRPREYDTLATSLFSMLAETSPRKAAEKLLAADFQTDGKVPLRAFRTVVGLWLQQEPEAALGWGLEQIKQDRLTLPPSLVSLAADWLKEAPATVLPRLSELDLAGKGDLFIQEVMAFVAQVGIKTDNLLSYLTSLSDGRYRQLMLEARPSDKRIIPWIAAQPWDGPDGVRQAFRTYLSFEKLSQAHIQVVCEGISSIEPGSARDATAEALQEALRKIGDQRTTDNFLASINDLSLRERLRQEMSQ